MRYFKVLDKDGKSCNGGDFQYDLTGKTWTPSIEYISPCQSGYHVCRTKDIIGWIKRDSRLFEVKTKGKGVTDGDDNKVVFSSVKIVRETHWSSWANDMFSADCAERVLKIFEKERPNDDRPRRAIAFARAAAGDAAGAAARDAAWDAAGAAAGAAARDAARDAAWAAARAAARDAEKKWQIKRLIMYVDGKIKKQREA